MTVHHHIGSVKMLREMFVLTPTSRGIDLIEFLVLERNRFQLFSIYKSTPEVTENNHSWERQNIPYDDDP